MAYKTLGMMKDAGMGKDANDLMAGRAGVPYLLANQRGVYLVSVSVNKRLVQGNPSFLFNTSAGHNGQFIFVMDPEGAIYSANKNEVQHHSAFLAGGPVAAAGWWKVEYGAVKWICNQSGHYQPPLDYTKQILTELTKRGVDVSGVTTDWTGAESSVMAERATRRGITFPRIGPKGVIASRF